MTRNVLLLTATTMLIMASCGSNDTAAVLDSDSFGNADGATVYQQRCASCHGTDLRGTDKGPSHLSIVYEPNHHNDDSFRSAIANGSPQHHWPFGDMPAVEGLSDDEIKAVIAYVRAEQERRGFEQ